MDSAGILDLLDGDLAPIQTSARVRGEAAVLLAAELLEGLWPSDVTLAPAFPAGRDAGSRPATINVPAMAVSGPWPSPDPSTIRLPGLRELRDALVVLAKAEGREAWPDDWFTRADPTAASRCRLLWSCVLVEGVREEVDNRVRGGDRLDGRHDGGLGWIGGPDFRMVCDLAGVEAAADLADELRRQCRSTASARKLRDSLGHMGRGQAKGA